MPFKHKLGLRKSNPDHRDHKYSAPMINTNKVLPLSYELPIIRAIYEQLDLNSCASHAVSQQILALQDYDKTTYPSRLFLYYNARTIAGDETEDNGTTFRDMYKGVSSLGWCEEDLWNYNPANVLIKPPTQCYDSANKTLVKRYKSLIQSEYAIKYALCEDLPVAIGLVIHENFKPDENGIIPLPSGSMVGSHALVIVAFSDHTRLFKILNSWSSCWGLGGFAYIPYDYVLDENLCHDLWIVTKE